MLDMIQPDSLLRARHLLRHMLCKRGDFIGRFPNQREHFWGWAVLLLPTITPHLSGMLIHDLAAAPVPLRARNLAPALSHLKLHLSTLSLEALFELLERSATSASRIRAPAASASAASRSRSSRSASIFSSNVRCASAARRRAARSCSAHSCWNETLPRAVRTSRSAIVTPSSSRLNSCSAASSASWSALRRCSS